MHSLKYRSARLRLYLYASIGFLTGFIGACSPSTLPLIVGATLAGLLQAAIAVKAFIDPNNMEEAEK